MRANQSTQGDLSLADEGGIDLMALVALTARHRYLIGALMLVAGSVASWVAFQTPLVYRAEVTVTNTGDAGSSGALLSSQIGGLASLAGISVGGNDKAQTAIATIRSRYLASEFLRRKKLLETLYPNKDERPSEWRAVQELHKNVISFREDKRAGTFIVVVDWSDPQQAALWANEIVALANEILRARAIEEAKRNIEYVNGLISKTDVVELRSAMYNIIESQTKTLMLANARAEYAFSIVDPAVAPEVRLRPKRTAIVGMGLLIGLFLGLAVAWIRNRIIGRKDAKNLKMQSAI